MRNNVTIVTKTFIRPWIIARLVRSAQTHFPDIPIVVADDGGPPYANEVVEVPPVQDYVKLPFDTGLGAGRNRAVEKVQTPYLLLCDDDFVFDANACIDEMLAVLDMEGLDLLAFRARGYRDHILPYHSTFRIRGKRLQRVGIQPAPGLYTPCELTLNCFIARTEAVRQIPWDDRLKLREHWDFFYRWKKAGKRVAVYNRGWLRHDRPGKTSRRYRRHRNRNGFHLIALRKHEFRAYDQ